MLKRFLFALAIIIFQTSPASAQQKYFVDGFHGGVYGHYPIMTYTQYLVDLMNKYPDWYVGLEIEPETWDTVAVKTPEAYHAFQEKLRTAQVEYTNPSYAQPYLYCTTGESIIRQFEYGMKKTREHFPDVLIATYAVEEPCFTSCLPGILSQFGFRHIVLKCPNTCWGGYSAPFGGELVNLIGPDQTSMLSVPRYACEALEKNSVWQTTAWSNSDEYYRSCFDYGIKNPVGMTYQDAGWTKGPWIGTNERRMRGAKYTRWTKYIEEQSVGTSTDNYRFSQEDVRPGLMWGSQVLQRLAQQCRVSEYLIPQAEKMSAMAFMGNGFCLNQKDIDEAWRTLLLSQHHDCWIVPYNRLNACGTWADNVRLWTDTSNKLAYKVMYEAVNSYKEYGSPALKVFNTSGHRRVEVINAMLDDGRMVDVKVDVPAFGYVIIPTDQLPETKHTKSIRHNKKECVMENDCVSIAFDLQKGGIIKSLKSKIDGFEYADNTQKYSFGELRGFFDKHKRFLSSQENAATVTVLEDNELVRRVRIDGMIDSTRFHNTFTLRQGSNLIDCSLEIEWNSERNISSAEQRDAAQQGRKRTGRNTPGIYIGDFTRPSKKARNDKRTTFYDTRYALSLMLPTSLKDTKLYKNAPFDVCESKLDNTFYNDWDSIKHNIILEWIDLKSKTDNHAIAIFTDHTTSYSFGKDYPLALTAQYSGPGLWGREYGLDGATKFRYALYPHADNWEKADISRLSTAWNEPLIAVNSHSDEQKSASFVDVTYTGLELVNAIKRENDILVRLFQTSSCHEPQPVRIDGNVTKVTEVDFLSNERKVLDVKKESDKCVFYADIPQFGVRTYKIERVQ